LDPCATSKNAKCYKFFTKKQDGLKQDWIGERVFVNPPFSDIDKWVEKCYKEGQKKDTFVVMILPSRTDTGYWHKYIMRANEIRFCKGRVNFLIQCNYCRKAVLKTILHKKKRFCQRCYNTIIEDNKKVGSGATFPLVVVIFEKYNPEYPIIKPFYHKEKDLMNLSPKLDKFIHMEV